MSVPGCSGTVLVKRYRITRRVHLVIERVAGIPGVQQLGSAFRHRL